MTSITGVSIEEAFSRSEEGKYGEVPVRYIGHSEFIANKRATGRKKDLTDLEALGQD